MGILIDTEVSILWERDGGRTGLGRWSAFWPPAIGVISHSELMMGVHQADTPERRDKRLWHKAVLSTHSPRPNMTTTNILLD